MQTTSASRALLALFLAGCAHVSAPAARSVITPPATTVEVPHALSVATQLVLVTTADWDTTGGTLQRYERGDAGDAWHSVGSTVPVVVGRTGLAWDDQLPAPVSAPVKREGDGKAPAGVFALEQAFGFAPASEAAWVRLPYLALDSGTECVDDVASVHYNTIVNRAAVPRVDWNSAEHMRDVGQYTLGVVAAYNSAPPRAGRGSCIFLHIWAGPGSYTAGCTAMPEHDLRDVMLWLDPQRHPQLVQLPRDEMTRVRGAWQLP